MSGEERAVVARAVDAFYDGEVGSGVARLEALLLKDGPAPPVCRVCGQRAWPGDAVRHIYSAHAAAEARRVA